MSNGSRLRLTGTLSKRRRGYLMTCDNGDVWVVEFADDVIAKLHERITIEGMQVGLDQLLADWIGVAI
jgi:Protein of unknown function (DUF5818)